MFSLFRDWRAQREADAGVEKKVKTLYYELLSIDLSEARSRALTLLESGAFFTCIAAVPDSEIVELKVNPSLTELLQRYESIISPTGFEITRSLIEPSVELPGFTRVGADSDGYAYAKPDDESIFQLDPTRDVLDVVFSSAYHWIVVDCLTDPSIIDSGT
jgi:hypothetical protein